MKKLADLFRTKVLRRRYWSLNTGVPLRIRVDALPVEQFRYQREAAAARMRSAQGA